MLLLEPEFLNGISVAANPSCQHTKRFFKVSLWELISLPSEVSLLLRDQTSASLNFSLGSAPLLPLPLPRGKSPSWHKLPALQRVSVAWGQKFNLLLRVEIFTISFWTLSLQEYFGPGLTSETGIYHSLINVSLSARLQHWPLCISILMPACQAAGIQSFAIICSDPFLLNLLSIQQVVLFLFSVLEFTAKTASQQSCSFLLWHSVL